MSYGLATQSQQRGVSSDVGYRYLLDYLDEDERAAVRRQGRKVAFARGEYLLLQGEFSDGLYLIEQGTVESIYRGSSGRNRVGDRSSWC